MREATEAEFVKAQAKAGWPAPRHMFTKRAQDTYYSVCGTEVAEKHIFFKRGIPSRTMYMVNPEFLEG
jgi:hypothetical protein